MLRFGVALTLIYLGAIISQIWFRLPSFYNLDLNEVGDFLAGVLGPVPIFWLILSFKQQGDELRAQAKELANSVREQQKLVEASTGQFKAMMDSLELQRETLSLQHAPKIDLRSAMSFWAGEKLMIGFMVCNYGNLARNIDVYKDFEEEAPFKLASFKFLERDDCEDIRAELASYEGIKMLKLCIHYEDVFGRLYRSIFSLSPMERTNELRVNLIEKGPVSPNH